MWLGNQETHLTYSWKEALEFVGYDFERWDSLEDIFQYAVSIPIVTRSMFRLDQTNHATRINLFLAWINDDKNNIQTEDFIPKEHLRVLWLSRARKVFHQFNQKLYDVLLTAKRDREAKVRYNGEIVSGQERR